MKALILGADGQVGRALTRTAPPGIDLHALPRSNCDVTDRKNVQEIIRRLEPAFVFNAAAYTAVDRAESEPDKAAVLNGLAPGWIAEAARQAGARTIHISTDYVFDGLSGRPYAPAARAAPLSVYGSTKRAGEEAVLAADPRALIVRTSRVHSARGRNFVRNMLTRMEKRDHLAIIADQIGTPTYAPSLAAALWTLGRSEASAIHHFTDAGTASWYDFSVAIQDEALALDLLAQPAAITPVQTKDYPTPARRPLYSVLDSTDTWRQLGGAPPHWRTNLRTCLRDIARNG